MRLKRTRTLLRGGARPPAGRAAPLSVVLNASGLCAAPSRLLPPLPSAPGARQCPSRGGSLLHATRWLGRTAERLRITLQGVAGLFQWANLSYKSRFRGLIVYPSLPSLAWSLPGESHGSGRNWSVISPDFMVWASFLPLKSQSCVPAWVYISLGTEVCCGALQTQLYAPGRVASLKA